MAEQLCVLEYVSCSFSQTAHSLYYEPWKGLLSTSGLNLLLLTYMRNIYVYFRKWVRKVITYRSACARLQYSMEIIEMVLDVACCGALLYPRARSWNVETCGPGHSVCRQKTVGMLLLVPLSIYTYTSLQFQNSFVLLILQNICGSYSPRGILELLQVTVWTLNVFMTYSYNTNKDVYYCRDVWLLCSSTERWCLCFIRADSRTPDAASLLFLVSINAEEILVSESCSRINREREVTAAPTPQVPLNGHYPVEHHGI